MTPAITENQWQGLIARVVDTGEQLIAGVNIHLQICPRIFKEIWNGPKEILMGPGDTDSWKKPEVKNLVTDSLSEAEALWMLKNVSD